uniref:Uncharacterized protein n=1 Tax=Rhizophora mucronata TaxID=61149 RepID=A0A2P2PRU5_RHIMU
MRRVLNVSVNMTPKQKVLQIILKKILISGRKWKMKLKSQKHVDEEICTWIQGILRNY